MKGRGTRSASPHHHGTSRPGSPSATPTDGSSRKAVTLEPLQTAHPINVGNKAVGKRKLMRRTPTTTPTGEETNKNNDYCAACGGVGRFLCCDACPKAFHFTCVEPPMEAEEVAELRGKWFCQECNSKKKPNVSKASRSATCGLFQKLIQDIECKNPKAFQLPLELRTFFEGVSTNRLGEYVDSSVIKHVKTTKGGHKEEPDYRRLKNKDGQFIVCYWCRKTALQKPMIACDYCSLHWHMDCLNPPMTNPPNVAKKWMCPNHVEHALPRKRKRKGLTMIQPASPLYMNNVDIEIMSESDQDEVMLDAHEGEELVSTNVDRVLQYAGLVYRLPAKSIKLDFMEYAKRARQSSPSATTVTTDRVATPTPSSTDLAQCLPSPHFSSESVDRHLLEDKQEGKHPDEETKEWLANLACFQAGPACPGVPTRPAPVKRDGIRMLAHAALVHDGHASPTGEKMVIDAAEYRRYKTIEELIRLKGEDHLMKLLTDETT